MCFGWLQVYLSYGLYSYGLYSYLSYGLYSYGLYMTYTVMVYVLMADTVMAYTVPSCSTGPSIWSDGSGSNRILYLTHAWTCFWAQGIAL